MKNTVLISALLLIFSFSYAQNDTLRRHNELTRQITENFSVLKSNKKLRQGEYIALTKDAILARGRYQDGKRIGEWVFGNAKGKLTQSYNYDTHKMVIFNDDAKSYKYVYTESTGPSDSVSNPIKIGGFFYSLFPMMFNMDLARQIHWNFPELDRVEYNHIFTVSATGEIIKHEVLVKTEDREKTYTLNDKDFDSDLKQFIPAMINNRPVECKVIVKTMNTFSTSMTTSPTTITRTTRSY